MSVPSLHQTVILHSTLRVLPFLSGQLLLFSCYLDISLDSLYVSMLINSSKLENIASRWMRAIYNSN